MAAPSISTASICAESRHGLSRDGVRLAHELIAGADEPDLGAGALPCSAMQVCARAMSFRRREGGGLLGHLAHFGNRRRSRPRRGSASRSAMTTSPMCGSWAKPPAEPVLMTQSGANFPSNGLVATLAATLPMPERVRITSLPARRP